MAQDFIIEDGILQKYTGQGGDVVIPEGVMSIENFAFMNCGSLTGITIPDSVTSIGWAAFKNCKSLSSVTIPKGVTNISYGTFSECSNLMSVTIPNSVKSIGNSAFKNCSNLKSVTIPEGVSSIVEGAFSGCSSLMSVTIPDSVTSIGQYAFGGCYKAEFFITEEGSNGINRFDIENGVLKNYSGLGGTVIIPESVTSIEDYAFSGCSSLKSVTIPESVKSIGEGAFYGCDCLSNIVFLGQKTVFGKEPFGWHYPKGLENICFSLIPRFTDGSLKEYILETELWDTLTSEQQAEVFLSRQSKTLDQGYKKCIKEDQLKQLGDALESCLLKKPSSKNCSAVASYMTWFMEKIPAEKLQTLYALLKPLKTASKALTIIDSDPLLRKKIGQEITLDERLSTGNIYRPIKLPDIYTTEIINPKSCAYAILYQSGKAWETAITTYIQNHKSEVNSILEEVIAILAEKQNETVAKRAVEFALYNAGLARPDTIKQLYAVFYKMKYKCLRLFIEDINIQSILLDGRLIPEGDSIEGKRDHPTEKLVKEKWELSETTRKLQKIITKGIPYVDSEELSSPEAVILIVETYAKQIDSSVNYYSMCKTSYVHSRPDPIADQIASCLDKEKLQDLLEELAFNKHYEKEGYLLPFGRYASPAQIKKLIAQMRAWENWGLYSATGRKNIIIGRGALMLSDTREAMMAVDKASALGYYASLRGTTESVLRDTVLSEFGFDTSRKKKYDLGGNVAVITLEKDLSLSIYDENAGKIVKSIPKKGSDEDLYDAAKKDFSDLKKNIKGVVNNRRDLLFKAFLSGTKFRPDEWKKIYMGNPILNAVASLIIWQQNSVFFTCDRTEKVILSDGKEYFIDENEMIKVAHPMEMSSEEIKNWQKYFIDYNLKQPFEQIWEPVYKENEISKDRYKGCSLPIYRFAGKSVHGITTWGFSDYSTEFGFYLNDCELKVKTDMERFTHEAAADAVYELGEFKIKYFSRYANHIIYLLDKWTIEERIEKNDSAIGTVLDSFTVAQVFEFIALASEKQSTDSLAVLMDYRNNNYNNFDPMTEFTIE